MAKVPQWSKTGLWVLGYNGEKGREKTQLPCAISKRTQCTVKAEFQINDNLRAKNIMILGLQNQLNPSATFFCKMMYKHHPSGSDMEEGRNTHNSFHNYYGDSTILSSIQAMCNMPAVPVEGITETSRS